MSTSNELSVDQTLWTIAKSRVQKPFKFAREKWVYLTSNNPGPFTSNAVSFTRAPSADCIDCQSFILSTPVSIVCSQQGASTYTNTLNHPQFVSFKPAGCLALVDRAVLTLNGQTVGIQNAYQSIYAWLKYLFQTSEDWHRSQGPLYLMGSELPLYEAQSCANNNMTTTITTGIYLANNNTIQPSGSSAGYVFSSAGYQLLSQGPYGYNRCLFSRCLNSGQPGSKNTGGTGDASADFGPTVSTRGLNILAMPSTSSSTTASIGVVITGYVNIKLSLLFDVFRALGLVQNLAFTLQVYFNSVIGAVPAVGGVTGMTNAGTLYQTINPLMVSTAGLTANVAPVHNTSDSTAVPSYNGNISNVSVIVGCSGSPVGNQGPGVNAGTNPTVNNVGAVNPELWFRQVELTGEQQQEFLAIPRNVLSYYDQYPVVTYQGSQCVTAGATAQHNLVGTLICPKKVYLLIWPKAAALANSVSAYQQCLSHEPYMSTYQAQINQIYPKIQGVPIFSQPVTYSWLDFVSNTSSNIGLNAALVPQISGTLMSKELWDSCKVYVWDLSRYTADAQPVSVVMSWVNLNSYDVDSHYIVESKFEASLEVSPSSFKLTSPATESY